jgi:acetolactate synthase I/II/III large subunit
MGSAVAGVIGGKLAAPERAAVAIVGDAAFAMHGVEVHTAVERELAVVWIVLNNAGHGMVQHGERMLYGSDLGFAGFSVPIDIAGFARSLSARGERVETPAELRDALRAALSAKGPTVIDAVIDGALAPPTLARRAKSLARFFSSATANPAGQ